ncbi:MAG: cytochrome b/b6 domain-containing protein [Deltaproteobacteria bacterium]|nr:cytochrome b/b6 domain-containing protein [Deltaproteobacteria bacterium]
MQEKHSKIKVWDLPTRLFHLLLILCVLGVFISSLKENQLFYHVWFGELILVLLLFRLGWGWLGHFFSRFGNFLLPPKPVLSYVKVLIKGENPKSLGHNPLAGWVMIFLLVLLSMITVSGLIVLGGEEKIGFLATLITVPQGHFAKSIHVFLSKLLVVSIGIHLLGVLLNSLLHKENYVISMITGKKNATDHEASAFYPKKRVNQVVFIVMISVLMISIPYILPMNYYNPLTRDAHLSRQSEDDLHYQKICGDCHFEFHPSLLPKRSWTAMLDSLEDHFGEDASLNAKDKERIADYLLSNSAEKMLNESAYKIMISINETNSPQRVTEVDYWKSKHAMIKPEQFREKPIKSKLNCGACHPLGKYGSFEDADIAIPNNASIADALK